MTTTRFVAFGGILTLMAMFTSADVLDKQKLLDAQTFWDNRDSDWYKTNIPFFECPDSEINTTYYYRWELVTKHLTYARPTVVIPSPSSLTGRSGRGPMGPFVARLDISCMKLGG